MPPKKINEDFDEDFDDEEFDGEEEPEVERAAPIKNMRGGPKKPSNPSRSPQNQRKTQDAPVEPQRRYAAFHSPERMGVVDVETNEVIGEDVHSLLADIIDRLERIENNLGSIMDN